MNISCPPTRRMFALDLIGPLPVVDEPPREIRQVVPPVVGVLVQKVQSVRQLAVANRLVINEQLKLLFALGFSCPHFAAFARPQLDVMSLIFVAFWFHAEAPLVSE